MDGLYSNLSELISGVSTATEYCLLYSSDVKKYEEDDHSIKWIIINKDWRWILKLINDYHSQAVFKMILYMYVYGDEDIHKFQSLCSGMESKYARLLASIIQGDVDFYRTNAIRVLDSVIIQLYYALLYNRIRIIDEIFTIYPTSIYKFRLNYLFTDERVIALRTQTTYDTISYFWRILVDRQIVDKNDMEFKEKLESMSIGGVAKNLLSKLNYILHISNVN